MLRYITPLILIGAAVGVFLLVADPLFTEAKGYRATEQSYNTALANSRQLKAVRDELLVRYNSFTTSDLLRLERMLPDNVDNIRLVIEIEKIASQYGMALRDVAFETVQAEDPAAALQEGAFVTETPESLLLDSRDYGTFSLSFTTRGTYANFVRFLGDLERNLRIVDIDSIKFSSEEGATAGIYDYDFEIQTYWLKPL